MTSWSATAEQAQHDSAALRVRLELAPLKRSR